MTAAVLSPRFSSRSFSQCRELDGYTPYVETLTTASCPRSHRRLCAPENPIEPTSWLAEPGSVCSHLAILYSEDLLRLLATDDNAAWTCPSS